MVLGKTTYIVATICNPLQEKGQKWCAKIYIYLQSNLQYKNFLMIFRNKSTWIEGLLRWPKLEVVCRGSCPNIMVCGLINRNASITTFPFTLWIGSTTTATALWFKASKLWFGQPNCVREQGKIQRKKYSNEELCLSIRKPTIKRVNENPHSTSWLLALLISPPTIVCGSIGYSIHFSNSTQRQTFKNLTTHK